MDFYGTIVEDDDIPIKEICSQVSVLSPLEVTTVEVATYWGHIFRQLCSQSFGDTFQTQKELELISLQHILQHFKVNMDPRILSQSLYEYWSYPVLFPESREVLSQCRIPVCLISNIDNAELQSALEHNKLHFELVVTSEDCRAYKPRGELFEKALSIIGLSGAETLHVGDSFNSDVWGAKQQGIPVLWINRRQRSVPNLDVTPDYISADLTGLLDIL